MCGIAGFVSLPEYGGAGKESLGPAVLRSLEHRGPDGQGWLSYSAGKVRVGSTWQAPSAHCDAMLLHRRLSIIDVGDGGFQPMSTLDGRYHLVFNGEIYNYLELREELQAEGCRFRTQSDTEVLLTALAHWGTAALPRLNGMFALALLDSRKRTLMLARDFFGIKPLYYWSEDGCVSFGSEMKALFAFGLEKPHANNERLLLYLRYGITDSGEETMLREVRQVPAAHYQIVSLDTCVPCTAVAYWKLEEQPIDITFDEAAGTVRALFLESVRLHLRSDVLVGSALSGGVDSSAIVMAIARLDHSFDIQAFSYVPEAGAPSEEKWIDIVARESGAKVHKVRASDLRLAGELNSMIHLHDEPFGSTSAYAQYLVFREAQKAGVKVMLDGQGADEILGGYTNYKGARLASLLRQHRWSQAARFLQKISGNGEMSGLWYCADFLLPPSLQEPARKLIGREIFPAWLNRKWFADRGAHAHFANYTSGRNVLRHSLNRSVTETLPGLLRYEDRNSMAASVESRVPFLTPSLVTFLARLPEQYLIDANGTTKAVFRKAMRGIVPDVILDRRDKVGFATPERNWIGSLDPWVRATLNSEAAQGMAFLNLDAARHELEEVRLGSRHFGFHVWRWINLIRWTEQLGVIYG